MSDYIKICALVFTPYLVVGAVLYFTRRSPKRRFVLLMPMLLAVMLHNGLHKPVWGWSDFVMYGFSVLCFISWGFEVFRAPPQK